MPANQARERFITPSGRAVGVALLDREPPIGRDAVGLRFRVVPEGSAAQTVQVVLPVFELSMADLAHQGVEPPEDPAMMVAVLAVLNHVESSDTDDSSQARLELVVGGDAAVQIMSRPRASDRQIRRFIARRVYDVYSRGDLESAALFDSYDYAIVGAKKADFNRNIQVLAAEGYLRVRAGAPPGAIVASPSVKLVREVERFGAAKEDVTSDQDYASVLAAYPQLGANIQALIAEHRRFSLAETAVELMSVFRATSPVVEAIAKRVLTSHGSARQHSSWGTVISELQERGLGDQALWSQLNHVVKFTRDLSLHGASLPEPVLRIASENAFAIVPQLAALLPRSESHRSV